MAKKTPANATVRLDKKATDLVREAAKAANRSINNEASTSLAEFYAKQKEKQSS